MRKMFHELGQKRAEILAKSMPMREARDKAYQEANKSIQEEFDARTKAIKEAEEGLYEIDMARGKLSRALNGKTGEPT